MILLDSLEGYNPNLQGLVVVVCYIVKTSFCMSPVLVVWLRSICHCKADKGTSSWGGKCRSVVYKVLL
jgi:hypothetical protein